jgi:hypothetical protein
VRACAIAMFLLTQRAAVHQAAVPLAAFADPVEGVGGDRAEVRRLKTTEVRNGGVTADSHTNLQGNVLLYDDIAEIDEIAETDIAAGRARRRAGKDKPAPPREQPWRVRAFPMPVESAGIADLEHDVVDLRTTSVSSDSRTKHTVRGSNLRLEVGEAGGRVARMRNAGENGVDVKRPASHRLEFRIDKFANHDDLLS